MSSAGWSRPYRRTLLEDPYNQPEEGNHVEFRLTYEGLLLATQKDAPPHQSDKRADHKHTIRQKFHPQLKRLWEITPFLKSGQGSGPPTFVDDNWTKPPLVYDIKSLAHQHSHYGFDFVPLVTRDLNLICGLDILFLRPDKPGGVIWAGDIDNRLKTLLDSLKIPDANERYSDRSPSDAEKPFFVLLEDDKLITKVSFETDQLLQYVSDPPNEADVRLIITVRLRPWELDVENMQFG
jgi:hypothetical protein